MKQINYPINRWKYNISENKRLEILNKNYELLLSCVPEIAQKYKLDESEERKLSGLIDKAYLNAKINIVLENRLEKIINHLFESFSNGFN